MTETDKDQPNPAEAASVDAPAENAEAAKATTEADMSAPSDAAADAPAPDTEKTDTPETDADAAEAEPAAPKLDAFDAEAKARAAMSQAEASAASPEALAAMTAEDETDKDDEIARLRSELMESEARLKRLGAELTNIGKRHDRERREADKSGARRVARELLPIYDNLSDTLRYASEELREKEPQFFTGVSMTRTEFLKVLSRFEIELVEPAIGDAMDPNRHEVLMEQPRRDVPPGRIAMVAKVGFVMDEKLIRAAQVVLAKAPADAPGAPEPAVADDPSDG